MAATRTTAAAVALPAVVPAPGHDTDAAEKGTRSLLARRLLEDGPSTVAVLAERLGLTAAGIRRHLDAMVADGLVVAREPQQSGSRGRGRPARAFTLTDAGREQFEQQYDDLARSALRFLAEVGGREAVASFARNRVSELEERYRTLLESVDPDRRPAVLAQALTADGYAASAAVVSVPGGEQLCQHHCPVAHVAGEFPELCAAETEVFARLLGTHVQRLATIAHGDGVCTTFVPASSITTRLSGRTSS